MVQDVSPEEFYDENEEMEYFQKKPKKPTSYQTQKKRYRKGNKYDSAPQASHVERRPLYDEDTGYEFRRPRPHQNFYDSYEDYQGASSITMKQVSPPNLAEGPMTKKEYFESEPVRKFPSTRQIQSVFPQQYTTHNSYVMKNFGLEDQERTGYHEEGERQHKEIDSQSMGSEQRPMLLPTGSSGIHIVKPPQFKYVVFFKNLILAKRKRRLNGI